MLTIAAAVPVVAVVQATTAGSEQTFPDVLIDAGSAASRIDRLSTEAPSSQRAALADDTASEGEYRAAMRRSLDCLVAGVTGKGGGPTVVPSAPRLSADAFELTYTYTVAGPVTDALVPDAISEIEQSCQATHLRHVELAYQLGKRSDASYVTQTAQQLESCVRGAGVDVEVDGRRAVEVLVELSDVDTIRAHPGLQRCLADAPAIATDLRPAAAEGRM
jgi:hypothetical protein